MESQSNKKTKRMKTFATVFEEKKKKNNSSKKRKRQNNFKNDIDDTRNHGKEENKVEEATSSSTVKEKSKKQRPPKKRHISSNNNDTDNNDNNVQKFQQKKKLTQEALDLSAQLKELSQRKRLYEAIDLYWDKKYDTIRDGFHACITIDCCARCGAMQEVDKILNNLETNGQPISIETNTSAIKGYAHAGDIQRAVSIFESMYHKSSSKNIQKQQKLKMSKPNVRTLNTLLRGCLWTAATLNEKDIICGGVYSSEHCLKLYREEQQLTTKQQQQQQQQQSSETSLLLPQLDVSSYEYSISLLCQALRVDDAQNRIKEFKQAYNIQTLGNKQNDQNQSALEALAVGYLALLRAKTLLGCKESALETSELARQAIEASKQVQNSSNGEHVGKVQKGHFPTGEKRAWKSKTDGSSRITSNTMFREHRMSELELELEAITNVCEAKMFPPASNILACRFVKGMFYFSGGGTTKLNDKDKKETSKKQTESKNSSKGRGLRRHVLNASWMSFGLEAALKAGQFEEDLKVPTDFLRIRDAERIYRIVGGNKQIIRDDGTIDFDKIFPGESTIKALDIELGSGHGDWIVHQATNKSDRNYVAVELRADRVSQIFAKGYLKPIGPLENLCVIGDDCLSFLSERVMPDTVATIYANHPEPPTQFHGRNQKELQDIIDGGSEPAHMLNSMVLVAASNCLRSSSSSDSPGRIVIVTDNMNYARLLCATIVKISRQYSSNKLRSCQLANSTKDLREIESFSLNDPSCSSQSNDRVILWEGQPSPTIGHAEMNKDKGASYFDRLWRTGASGHASHRERYIIVVERWDNM